MSKLLAALFLILIWREADAEKLVLLAGHTKTADRQAIELFEVVGSDVHKVGGDNKAVKIPKEILFDGVRGLAVVWFHDSVDMKDKVESISLNPPYIRRTANLARTNYASANLFYDTKTSGSMLALFRDMHTTAAMKIGLIDGIDSASTEGLRIMTGDIFLNGAAPDFSGDPILYSRNIDGREIINASNAMGAEIKFGDSGREMLNYIADHKLILSLNINDGITSVFRAMDRPDNRHGAVFYIHDKLNDSWKTLFIEGGFSDVSLMSHCIIVKRYSWLDEAKGDALDRTKPISKGSANEDYQSLPTGEYLIYDRLGTLLHSWKIDKGSEFLAISNNLGYYKTGTKLFKAPLSDATKAELICDDPAVERSHWLYISGAR